MTDKQAAVLTNSDQTLHSIISNLDELELTLMSEINKGKINEIQTHLLSAHQLIHELYFSE